jgi:hypothetical protein
MKGLDVPAGASCGQAGQEPRPRLSSPQRGRATWRLAAGGDDRRALTVAILENLKQEAAFQGIERRQSPVVKYEDIKLQKLCEQFVQIAGTVGYREIVKKMYMLL